ncbi:UDP-N-acetylglucosamine--N-acetylmuramyl-(pentapeptide) pyrophosphoryl-undecaprenol N-acetylglucosamine transferase [Candidatus Dependentiae bacterium]|nr:UDP-N-acetylglucosamine--N-acetylmuramyl-(pentapeptide) pyrophosphoryl-undecaprenol N-acetylglucosamine transferase [Candidatus Dependentiae bacterium]
MSPLLTNTIMTICFVAGKSGGHLVPCLTKAKEFQQQNQHAKIYLFSSGSILDHAIIDKQKEIKHVVPTNLDNPPYSKPWLLPWFTCKTIWYFTKSLYYLHQIKPQKVICFGGFVSIPTILAAKILKIPFEIYELNVEPGKATNFLSKFTDTIHICFKATAQYFSKKNCVYFEYPIRFTSKDLILDKTTLLEKYNLKKNKMTFLILGGSQGSILLNEVFKNMIKNHPDIASKIQIIHQTGNSDPFDYKIFYKEHEIPSVVFDYHSQLEDFYNLADFIICRAGAGTLFEIRFFKKNCLTIPHKTGQTNHQIQNVLELQKEFPDQFNIIEQDNFTDCTLFNYLTTLHML